MIKYGSHVAFLQDGQIRFGYVSAIVQRTNHEGEKTEYVVTSVGADGTANSDTTIKDEEQIADLTDSWRKGDALAALARKSNCYQWADKQSEQILNPPELESPAPPIAVEVPDTDQPL